MNSKNISRHISLIFILTASIIGTCNALADSDHDEALKLKEAGEILPLELIITKARQQHSGHILEIELEHKDGRYIYELEILDDKGTIWELEYNAQNGELINHKKDD